MKDQHTRLASQGGLEVSQWDRKRFDDHDDHDDQDDHDDHDGYKGLFEKVFDDKYDNVE